MTTETVTGAKPARKFGLNTFDSPWLNRRFITGCLMMGFVVAVGIFGPLFWDPNLSLVGSAPLNLPPAWIQEPRQPAASNAAQSDQAEAEPTAAATATSSSGFGASGLGGSGLSSLMSTQQSAPTEVAPTQASGFGSSGLGGSGLSSLMSTQSAPTAAATATSSSGFGASGLGGTGLSALMSTQTSPTEVAPTQASETTSTTTTTTTTRGRYDLSGTWEHPLGTDNSGRDILAVLIVGAPASLRVGVIAALVGTILGIILGFSSGFLGGWVDAVIRTAADVWLTIPALAVLLVISAYMKRVDLETMGILLALFAWPGPTRLLRAQVLTLRERGYVRMAQLSGQSTFDIMFREMLPNLLPYLAASFAGNVSGAILAATSLEALGLGPTRFPTLGTTIFNALRGTAIMRGMWWWWGLPVLTLIFMFTGLFQIAVGLDEIANPRLRGVQGK
jgi:peptide/nickel transport system permease protein